ncbi:hypothetical protein [Sorangium sp. So ce1099]|uniref:hypothetical protein n=1 Tax=Sorangium sp. So ce1099 TaxID=3133331 RepID=UPI003F6203AD
MARPPARQFVGSTTPQVQPRKRAARASGRAPPLGSEKDPRYTRSALMLEVLRNAHFVVIVDHMAKLVRVTRTAEPFESLEQIEQKCLELIAALDLLDRRTMSLFLDIRAGPPRNDPEFEEATRRLRIAAVRGFARIAVLVQTSAGALQVRRHGREDGIDHLISDDEHELLAYLAAPPPRRR